MILLIDADIVAFRAAVVTQETTDWGDGQVESHGDLERAKDRFHDLMEQIVHGCGGGACILVYSPSDGGNWRKDEWADYKANRKGVSKPVVYSELVEWSKTEWESMESPKLEADDLLGITSTLRPGETIICSIDKDMKTIPGTLYNWDKDKEPWDNCEEEALYALATQTITGDSTDGYKGLPRVGPKGAEKILKGLDFGDPAEVWSAVLEAFEDKGYGQPYMIQQARLARICRHGDWDFDTLTMTWKPEGVEA